MRCFCFAFLLILLPLSLFAEESSDVHVDLQSPMYEDGVLTTDNGGVIEGPNIRIQAKKITYVKRDDQWTVRAQEDLIVHYQGYCFTGNEAEYDFLNKKGLIDEGRTQIGSWYLGGHTIFLEPRGNYRFKGLYLTTCEREKSLWQLHVQEGTIEEGNLLKAKNLQVKVFQLPIFWFPYFWANLSTLQDLIAKYEFITGGTTGERLGMRYQIYSWRNTRVFLQADYWFTRGPTTSLQFDYENAKNFTTFKGNNFIAFDYHGAHPYGIFRNRFVGEFQAKLFDQLEIEGAYDKLSDSNVLETYFNRDYFLQIERRTRLQMRLQKDQWIGFLRTEARINPFDVVSQELPYFQFDLKPFTLFSTPLVADLSFNAGYLDYVYGNIIVNSPHNFRSPRVEIYPRLYLPFHLGPISITPRAEYIGIGYGQSLVGHAVWSSLGELGALANISASKKISPSLKHIVEPYTEYTYYSKPTIPFENHYLFNFRDSYVKINQLKWGLRNSLYYKLSEQIYTPLFLDIYTYGFFNNTTIGAFVPKLYLELSSKWPSLYVEMWGGYNFQHNVIDSANAKLAYTFNEDLACSFSFRHRSRYDYKKADHDNYFLDVFRSQADLLASPLSDRRDIFLTSVYWKPLKKLILEFKSRTGWHRVEAPFYNELFFTVTVLLPCNWRFIFNPRRTVVEGWRWDFRFELGEAPPKEASAPFVFW
ncbi:MAG: hypothetical protein S4CHLAM7_05620 [Chlamydiae bacterium]|nr:hypothetical protein [Chlamydiota bacterium]